jgi:dTDP-glucose 4,6-dehydratase
MPGSDAVSSPRRLAPEDLHEIVEGRVAVFEGLRGRRIFITGGTGFMGRWLLESLLWANDGLQLDVRVTMLTRYPDVFRRRAPHLANHSAVRLLTGDVRSFELPDGNFDLVVHLAAETNTQRTNPPTEVYFDVILGGTRRVLDLAERAEAGAVMLVSSGAVYGAQPMNVERLREEDPYGPLPVAIASAYGEAKRCAEMVAYARGERTGIRVTVGRCFAFVGPHLPLDSGFAVGNFIGDALAGRVITVKGDGTPRRTYMYAGDMARWLWSIAVDGQSRHPYNVGSNEVVTIAELAGLVATTAGGLPVRILGASERSGVGTRYVPDITRAHDELGLSVEVGLRQAIERTLSWHREPSEP